MTSGHNISDNEDMENMIDRENQEFENEENIRASPDNTLYENQGAGEEQ